MNGPLPTPVYVDFYVLGQFYNAYCHQVDPELLYLTAQMEWYFTVQKAVDKEVANMTQRDKQSTDK